VAWAGLAESAGRADLHRAAGVLLHPDQARHVRRHGHRVPADRHADLQIHRARPLQERARAFLPFLIASPLLFLLGAALVYFFFTPMVMWFFLAMQQTGGEGEVQISLLPKVSEYLSLIMTLIFSFGLVFQLPVVTTLMARVGLLSIPGAQADKRKWAIVIAFVVAAVLTPPDPISQIGLAVPTILLYEISIICAGWVEKKREEERVEREAADATPPAKAEPTA
jgi:sec-independent protein translocase protein TatC